MLTWTGRFCWKVLTFMLRNAGMDADMHHEIPAGCHHDLDTCIMILTFASGVSGRRLFGHEPQCFGFIRGARAYHPTPQSSTDMGYDATRAPTEQY
eukprot:3456169-Rhodomonas_salina.8